MRVSLSVKEEWEIRKTEMGNEEMETLRCLIIVLVVLLVSEGISKLDK